YTVAETAGSVTITVNLEGSGFEFGSIGYITSDGTAMAGEDYTGTDPNYISTVDFVGYDTSKTFTIPIIHDWLPEGDETFTVSLFDIGDWITVGEQSTTTVTITDNDLAVTAKDVTM